MHQSGERAVSQTFARPTISFYAKISFSTTSSFLM